MYSVYLPIVVELSIFDIAETGTTVKYGARVYASSARTVRQLELVQYEREGGTSHWVSNRELTAEHGWKLETLALRSEYWTVEAQVVVYAFSKGRYWIQLIGKVRYVYGSQKLPVGKTERE